MSTPEKKNTEPTEPKEPEEPKEPKEDTEEEEDDGFDDYDDDMSLGEDDIEDGGELEETLTNLFTTEEGSNLAEVVQETADHLENITKLLSNQNKILIKMLQSLASK